MRKPGNVIPDSEDDSLYSGMSLKDYSPSPRPDFVQRGGSPLSQSRASHVIRDSGDEGDGGQNVSGSISKRTRNRTLGNIEVVIPTKKDGSPSDSSGSSLGGPSASGTTGFNTPATSVGVTTESDIKKPRARVNASERASRLQSSSTSRRTSQRGTKRDLDSFTAWMADSEETDAALAYATRAVEPDVPAPKKRKTMSSARVFDKQELRELLDTDLSESEMSDRLSSLSSLSGLEYSDLPEGSEASEDEGFAAMERGAPRFHQASNRLLAFDNQEDPDDPLLTWEEQRKLRRVSPSQCQPAESPLTLSFSDANGSEEA